MLSNEALENIVKMLINNDEKTRKLAQVLLLKNKDNIDKIKHLKF